MWQLNSIKIVEGYFTSLFVAGGSHASHRERPPSAHFQTPFQGSSNYYAKRYSFGCSQNLSW
ncbi:hypothetical protein Bca101_059063 [Brassica carinata]